MKRALVTIAGFILTVSSMAAAPPPPEVSAVAAATEEIGHNAEDLYDWGRQSNWTRARAALSALKGSVAKLEALGAVASLEGTAQRVGAMETAIQKRQRRDLMHAANEMTAIAAELSRPLQPPVPPDVALLDYNGRELELWAEEGNPFRLHEARMRVREAWNIVRPAVVAKGGAVEAQQFDVLVDQLNRAKTSKQFGASATPILDSVDALEAVFTRSPIGR